MSTRNLSALSPSTGIIDASCHLQLFPWVLGTQTQVLLLTWPAFHSQGHLPSPALICYAFVCWELLSRPPSLGLLMFLATFTSSKATLDLPSGGAEMVPGHSRNWVSVLCLSALLPDLNIQRQHFCPLLGSYLPMCGPGLCRCRFPRP